MQFRLGSLVPDFIAIWEVKQNSFQVAEQVKGICSGFRNPGSNLSCSADKLHRLFNIAVPHFPR